MLGLELKSLIINTKCGLLLDIWTNIFFKLVITESNSSKIWLADRYNEIMLLLLLLETSSIRHSFKQELDKHLTGRDYLKYTHHLFLGSHGA